MIIEEIALPSGPDLLRDYQVKPTSDNPCINLTTTSSCNYLRQAIVTAHQSENVKNLLLPSWAPNMQQNYTYIRLRSQEAIQKNFLGGGSKKKCDQNCDQTLIKSS